MPAPHHKEQQMPSKPTSRQLSYLKALADRTGQTFTYPHTAAEASAQINRLKNTRPSSRTERGVERKLIADQIQAGPADSARVRDDEIAGHGSSATWTQNRDQERPAPEDPGPAASVRRAAKVGERTELARYSAPTASASYMASGWTGSSGSLTVPPAPAAVRIWSSASFRPKASSMPWSLTTFSKPRSWDAPRPACARWRAIWTPWHDPPRSHPHRPRSRRGAYAIDDEIWQQSLTEAIEAEADTIASMSGSELLQDPSEASRPKLRAPVRAPARTSPAVGARAGC